jgi:predicted HD superfamily hydrolase involved in NAD metabolism
MQNDRRMLAEGGCRCCIEEICEYARAHLEPERFCHVKAVAACARELADCHGVDSHRAEMAAWLHDLGKGLRRTQQQLMAASCGNWEDIEPYPGIWHASCSGLMAKEIFRVQDHEVIQVVTWHPTGHADFGPLGHVLFVSDYCEPGRNFKGRGELWRLACHDLRAGACDTVRGKFKYLLRKHQAVHPAALEYWNSLVK